VCTECDSDYVPSSDKLKCIHTIDNCSTYSSTNKNSFINKCSQCESGFAPVNSAIYCQVQLKVCPAPPTLVAQDPSWVDLSSLLGSEVTLLRNEHERFLTSFPTNAGSTAGIITLNTNKYGIYSSWIITEAAGNVEGQPKAYNLKAAWSSSIYLNHSGSFPNLVGSLTNNSQNWIIVQVGPNSFTLQNKQNSKYLDDFNTKNCQVTFTISLAAPSAK